MGNPTFHLEAVVKNKDELGDFEGPLNLILMLLSKNKIEIRDIQISVILEQYLEQISQMQKLDLNVASEFVQMASHLTYIKTRMLLAGDEEVSELEQLITSLEMLKCKDAYIGIKTIVPSLAQSSEEGILMFSTPGETMPQYGEYSISHTPVELFKALSNMLTRSVRGAAIEPLTMFMPERIVYGVREKSRELIELLRERGACPLSEMYSKCKSRSELVATFVSVLELCSSGNLTVSVTDDGYLIDFVGGETDDILENISE